METEMNNLLNRRLIDLTGAEFLQLQRFGVPAAPAAPAPIQQAIGISVLADALSCSPSQVSKMQKAGVLQDAIISHVGRNYVFDIQKAREAAIAWKEGGNGSDSVPATV